MSTQKTIATELGLCFGVLNISLDNSHRSNMLRVENVTDHVLDRVFDYYTEIRNRILVDRMWSVGRALSPALRSRVIVSSETTQWSGETRQSASTRVGRDLVFNNLQSVSVKADSNVISNRSPRALIEDLPSGTITTSRGSNWFAEVAPNEYQEFYSMFNPSSFGLPENINDYDRGRFSRKREFKRHVQNIFGNEPFHQQLYNNLCERVSVCSAQRFTSNMSSLFGLPGSSPLIRNFCENYFRINSTPYILAGLDNNIGFAVEVPGATTWNSCYDIRNIYASPGIGREQPIVFISIELVQRSNGAIFNFEFRLEIRWSHGKFCGAPEGKLYKDFLYVDLPWVDVLVNQR